MSNIREVDGWSEPDWRLLRAESCEKSGPTKGTEGNEGQLEFSLTRCLLLNPLESGESCRFA